ncbi:MAG: RNA polymerase sigma factor [Gaiellaceae bacterium]
MAVAHEASSAVRLQPAASEAAERLFQQHSGWIYGYCLRHLRSPEEAEDALQATYLNACRSLKQGFVPRADSAWLFRVAHNVCITRLRSTGRRARLEWTQDRDVLEQTVAAPERAADELIGLPEALATLPELQRRAILLREWQGLSYREVADELGLTQSAVETLIFRARRSLASALEHPDARRPRALHGFNVAGLGAALKSLLAGGVGVKVAATAAVAATATVVALDPVGWHRPAAPDSAPKASAAVATAPPAALSRPAADAVEHQALASTPAGAQAARGTELAESKRAGKTDRSARGKGKARGRERAERGRAQAERAQSEAGSSRSAGQAARPTFAGSGGPPPHAASDPPGQAAKGAPKAKNGPEKPKKP